MNKKVTPILLGFLFLSQLVTFGQSADSIAVVSKEWKATPIQKGITWKQGHFDKLFESQQEINFVEINLKKYRKKMKLAADPKELKKTSQFASEVDALVAINGGFFDMKNGGASDYVKVDHQVVNRKKKKTDRVNAVLLISKKAIKIQADSAINYEQSKVPNILLSGPLLIQRGLDATLADNAFNKNRHPRSAIAITGKKKLILLVVDGRNKLAAGMNLSELTQTLRWLGAKQAMNLDGGGSSTLYIKGATENSIVNYPCDNKQFDHEGQRSVANIIYLKE
ncbi:phosphodiester glycosidase family protein [Olivibacter sp. CPCC 100613]|uniref:phosphodiester glycosidase family protein n=1 Tax=Olivibacter sp. CPCC 100613 TaxID=3079931 RepID=UPI002FF84649